ncbi:MAG TPA: SDR family oxidoreductase [Gemmataceae bacterium]|nr:SDR family oxidoreductase [Gemmataceae bacterium]
MIPIDLSGKVALVTGVGDNVGFAWHIAKALRAAGSRIILAVHPRLMNIVENILQSDHADDVLSRQLPYGAGALTVEKMLPCDVGFDTMADVPEETRSDRRYKRVEDKFGDYSVQGTTQAVAKEFGGIDVLIHSVAFSPEITHLAINTSRKAYLTALSVSAYSLTALLRAAEPFMEGRPGGASAVGLTYLGGQRVVGHYGGGMSSAKAALEIDAKQLANNLGPKNIRVNLISAGPYASRAASSIKGKDEGGKEHSIHDMIKFAAAASPLKRPITPDEVANTTAFLCSPLASAITGAIVFVDCGYNVMGVPPSDLTHAT